MGLNCKPEQLVWIDVPRSVFNDHIGLTLIHGHVVTTKHLHPDAPVNEPTWVVDPPQKVTVQRAFTSRGAVVPAGVVLGMAGVPDAWLRPFKDIPPEQLRELQLELQRELVS